MMRLELDTAGGGEVDVTYFNTYFVMRVNGTGPPATQARSWEGPALNFVQSYK